MAARWAVLLTKFADDLSEPHPRRYYEELFTPLGHGQGPGNLVDYFAVNSRDAVRLDVDVVGWTTLTQRRADYVGSGVNQQGRTDLENWAIDQSGIDAGVYDVILVLFNIDGVDSFGRPGRAVCDEGSVAPGIIAHEMGHALGLKHSQAEAIAGEYQDPWDIMTAQSTNMFFVDPKWGKCGPGINAANLMHVGWVEPNRVWKPPTQAAFEESLDLRPLYDQTDGFIVAELPGRKDHLFVSFRLREGWDRSIPRSLG